MDDDSRVDKAGHLTAARRIEEGGITLLKNRHRALPLNAKRLRSLAVIGSDGDGYRNGGGSSNVNPYSFVSVRQGITARAGSGVKVRYAPGTDLAQAERTARGADAAVVVVSDTAAEGVDKPCLGLDCGATDSLSRDALIARVAKANPRTIVVLQTGGPVLTPWRDRVEGIVEAWYSGAAGGSAVARVLFGDVDPGGRLPATFPNRAADLPTAGDPRRYPGVDETVTLQRGGALGYRGTTPAASARPTPSASASPTPASSYGPLQVGPPDVGSALWVSLDRAERRSAHGRGRPPDLPGAPRPPGACSRRASSRASRSSISASSAAGRR